MKIQTMDKVEDEKIQLLKFLIKHIDYLEQRLDKLEVRYNIENNIEKE